MMTQNQRSLAIFGVAGVLLIVPLIAMQFTKEVNWAGSDFLIGEILLFGTAFICDLVLRKVKTLKARVIICLTVLAILIVVWAEMAVGIFGTPFAGS